MMKGGRICAQATYLMRTPKCYTCTIHWYSKGVEKGGRGGWNYFFLNQDIFEIE